MQTECSAKPSAFGRVEGRPVVADFDGGALTSDAGGLLLGAADQRLDLVRRLAGCFRDARDPRFVEHSVATLIGQRVFGIALGYEDLNDHDELRHDPLMAVLAGKLEAWRSNCAPAAGKSTLNRLELSREIATRYHKIRNARATCSPTGPRPPRCAPTNCGCGSPLSPMFSSARSGESALPTPSSPRPPAARSGSSFSSSPASSASARDASSSRSPRLVPTPTNGAWPQPASPEAPPRRRQNRGNPPRGPQETRNNPTDPRAKGATEALVPSHRTHALIVAS